MNLEKLLNINFLKFHRNLFESFGVTLKALLGLAMPYQYCQAVIRKFKAVLG